MKLLIVFKNGNKQLCESTISIAISDNRLKIIYLDRSVNIHRSDVMNMETIEFIECIY